VVILLIYPLYPHGILAIPRNIDNIRQCRLSLSLVRFSTMFHPNLGNNWSIFVLIFLPMALPLQVFQHVSSTTLRPCRASHCYGMGYPSPASAVALPPRSPRPRDGSSRGPPRHSLLFLGQDGMGWMAPIRVLVNKDRAVQCKYNVVYIYQLYNRFMSIYIICCF